MLATIVKKVCVYVPLIGGALIFTVPLIWMVITALKPLEQTMSMPPTWIPYQWQVEMDEHTVNVRRGETFTQRVIVLRDERTGMRRVETISSLEARGIGSVVLGEPTETHTVAIDRRDASPDDPLVRVYPEPDDESSANAFNGARWMLVPAASLEQVVKPRWSNFPRAIEAMGYFPQYLRNTLILCVLTVIGTVVSSTLAAYGFARISWRGRRAVFAMVLATMMIPFPVVMVPLYTLFHALGWIGTLKPLWVGTFFAAPFNVFLLRQFFMTIPNDICESARLDGAGELRVLLQIVVPLSRHAIAVVALFQFMGTWNDFLGPLIYLTDQEDFTLALGLQFFQSQHGGTEWHYLMAASTLVVLPVIVVFFFAQRTFIEGISLTGIKG